MPICSKCCLPRAALGLVALSLAAPSIVSALDWTWSYIGLRASASGTLTTRDVPDDSGWYDIIEIMGMRCRTDGCTFLGACPS